MPTTFRPYQPDQGLLLPSDLRDWLPAGHLAHHVSDLVDGLDLTAFLRAVLGRRSAQVAVRAADDGEGSDLRVRDGVFSSRGLAREAGGGRGLSGSGSGELSEPPDDLRVSAASSWGFQAVVRGSGAVGGGDRRGELRQVVDRRDEGSGERLQAQGDELRADAGGGAASSGGDRGVVGSGGCGGRAGGRAVRGGFSRGRAAGGVAPAGGPFGGDPGGEGTFGGSAARGR